MVGPFSDQEAAFLREYRRTGDVRLSSQLAGVGKTTVYRWIRKRPSFRAQMIRFELENYQKRLRVSESAERMSAAAAS